MAGSSIRDFLLAYTRKTVTLDILQQADPVQDYERFRRELQQLLAEGILQPVKAGGADYRGLPRKVKISRGRLFSAGDTVQKEAVAAQLSPRISLDYYYQQPLEVWEKEKPFLRQISDFLKKKEEKTAPLQQRSWEIFHNEKFLLEGGEKLLHHAGLSLPELGIAEQPDPLMLAVNPRGLAAPVCQHLAVENKAPYEKLLPFLPRSGFASLILGYGWKIAGNLGLLPVQCGRQKAEHIVWYFGDFDWEGLRIWQVTAEKSGVQVRLAVPFYRKFLQQPAPAGKSSQQEDAASFHAFLQYFSKTEQQQFAQLLQTGHYFPQEALTPEELEAAWKELAHGAGTFWRADETDSFNGSVIPPAKTQMEK